MSEPKLQTSCEREEQDSEETSSLRNSSVTSSEEQTEEVIPFEMETEATGDQVPEKRKRGHKARRELDQAEMMRIMQRNMEEQNKIILTLLQDLREGKAKAGSVETVRSDSAGTTSSGATGAASSRELHLLVKERQQMETSKGEWKSDLLEGVELPEEWPMYEWPKWWSGRGTIQRALLALHELQKDNTLLEALKEMKSQTQRLGRYLSASDFRIIQPILEGKPSLEHDAWEITLMGIPDLPVQIPSWLHVCRSVKPAYVSDRAQWLRVIHGGEWPSTTSKGFKIGVGLKERKGHHHHNSQEKRQDKKVQQPQHKNLKKN